MYSNDDNPNTYTNYSIILFHTFFIPNDRRLRDYVKYVQLTTNVLFLFIFFFNIIKYTWLHICSSKLIIRYNMLINDTNS